MCVSKNKITKVHFIWFSYLKFLRFQAYTAAAHTSTAEQNISNKAKTFNQIKKLFFIQLKANETQNQFQLVSVVGDFTPAPNCIPNFCPNYQVVRYYVENI